jgi:aspartyl-tRNA synthetase
MENETAETVKQGAPTKGGIPVRDVIGLDLLRQLVSGQNALREMDVFACNAEGHDLRCECFWEQCEAWAKADAQKQLTPPQ